MDLTKKTFRKIPIVITKHDDGETKGWRAEVPDNWDEWKTSKYKDINFEDLGFHFWHNQDNDNDDQYVFFTRKEATLASKYVINRSLKGNAKIWYED